MELIICRDDLAMAIRRLRTEIDSAGSQSAFARLHGLTHTVVSQTLRGRIDPPPVLLAALGLRRVVRYLDAPPINHTGTHHITATAFDVT